MIALSHGGTTTYSPQAPSRDLVAGTADGIVILDRDVGGEWRVAHRALSGLHVSAIVMPEPGVLFAGVFRDSVYMSTDSGRSWTPRGDGLGVKNVYSLLAVPKGNGYTLYAGTQPAHLFRSDDKGASWKELPGLREVPSLPRWNFPAPPHEAHVKHLVADPRDPSGLYACIEQGALLKSTDEGASWREMPDVDEDVHFLSIDPRDAQRMVISSGIGCYASDNGGAAWKRITTQDDPVGGYPDTLVRQPSDPDVMFLGAARGGPAVWRKTRRSDSHLCRSQDGGRTWEFPEAFPHDLVASIQAIALEESGRSVSLYLGTTSGEILEGADGGGSWKTIAAGLPPISKYGLDRALQGI
jgi:photosystem II stability/assembly factor-like uncharacterized protein